jgi:hypothetical protein
MAEVVKPASRSPRRYANQWYGDKGMEGNTVSRQNAMAARARNASNRGA